MLQIISGIADFVLNMAAVIIAVRWAARRTTRLWVIVLGTLVGFVYSIVSDFTISYATPDYDRSFHAVMINALLTAVIGFAIAFFATLRRASVRQQPLAN